MAKERTNQLDCSDDRVGKRKKTKSRSKRDERGKGRPSFCPNKSKSFNASITRSFHRHHVSTTALKKNNEELAKSLNKCKGVISHLQTEKLELESRNMELRAQYDEAINEAEVQRRVVATLLPVKKQINQAIDNMVGLSDNLTQSLQLVSAPLRMSTQSSGGARGSSVGPSRGSSIGVGPNFRMRPIMNFPARDSSSAGTSAQSKNSPPKQLSKVSPMVAGHAISRPRIQLTRMDIEAMSAARDQLGQDNEVDDNDELNEDVEQIEEENGEVDVIQADALPHPGRSLFNLTNIGEENSVLLADESILEESNSAEQVDQLAMLEEERDSTPDISIRRRSRSHVRESSEVRRITRVSPEDSSQARRSVSLASLAPIARIAVQSPSATSPQARLARPPLRQISAPSSSPQVDIMKTQRHPAIIIPDLVQMNHPDLPTRYSQPSSTPLLPTPSPASKRTSAPVFSDFPENPSESFLEQMIDSDPMEGPSWLFAPSTKKRRSSVARRLSTVLSLSDRERGGSSSTATMDCTSLNSSDIDMSNTGEGLSSAEVSGYVLAKDLLETAVVLPAHDSINTSGPVEEDNPSSSSVGLSRVSDDDLMDLTSPANKESGERLNNSNQENAPVGLVGPSSIYESNLSISVSNTPRTPLSSLTYTDPSGEVVKFNPRTDTGVTVARLREARILLDNVGMGDDGATTPYKLSECYIDLSPGRSMSLDQLFSLGLRAGIQSPSQSPKVVKRKHVSEMTKNSATPSKKKRRVTDMPSIRQRGVRASLDMIPAPNIVAAPKKGNMVDTSKQSKLSNAPNVYEGVIANRDDENVPRSGRDIISDALTDGRTNVYDDEVPDSIEIVQRKSVDVEKNKKMSMIPSFVRLEKSPVKLVGIDNEAAVVNYESVDMIHCVGGKAKVDAIEEIETIVEVPEPERRRRTKVDYAALLNDDVDDNRKSKSRRVTEAPSRKSSKSVNKKGSAAVLTGELSGLNDDGSNVSGHAKKSAPIVPCPGVQSDDEPESMPSSLEPVRGPGNFGVGSNDSEVDEGGREEPNNELISGLPPTEDVSSTSRGSLAAAAPVASRSSSSGAEDASEGRGGGRSRRGNVVSYKEPPLGKKLRQGDAGSTSVYTDFKPKAKSRKSSKKK